MLMHIFGDAFEEINFVVNGKNSFKSIESQKI